MLNVLGARRALILGAVCLLPAACTRNAAPDAAAAADAAPMKWAQEALARNPDLEVVATDPEGIFTVRERHGGDLRTVRVDELVAAPPGMPLPAAAAVAEIAPLPEAPESQAVAAQDAVGPMSGITVTREAGRLSITGPGVTIASADGVRAPTEAAAASPGPPQRQQVEHRGNQPIVCQGGQMMHIDNRAIEFDGDGLVVEDGCDLYLTNSRITAGGTAIVVTRGQVHIVNSTVKGRTGSIEASQGSQVFMSSASIDGLQRRFDTAQINDLGGNRYR